MLMGPATRPSFALPMVDRVERSWAMFINTYRFSPYSRRPESGETASSLVLLCDVGNVMVAGEVSGFIRVRGMVCAGRHDWHKAGACESEWSWLNHELVD